MEIYGKPEGRPGIWLISADTACDIIAQCPGEMIHNFIESSLAMLGADWDKPHAAAQARREGVQCALIFPPNVSMGHQLVMIGERRWSFDVGKIDESDMVEETAAAAT